MPQVSLVTKEEYFDQYTQRILKNSSSRAEAYESLPENNLIVEHLLTMQYEWMEETWELLRRLRKEMYTGGR